MKYDTLNKKEFIDLCLKENVYQDDIFEEIKRLTNNFDKIKLTSFFQELKSFGNNLTFEIVKENEINLDPYTKTKTYKEYKIITIQDYLNSYIWELTEKNEPETSINSIREIINTTDLHKKIRGFKILNPECEIIENYLHLTGLYDIAINEYNKITEPAPTKGTNKHPQTKQSLTFSELFKPEFRKDSIVEKLLQRLVDNSIIDNNHNWVIINAINEPSKLYYYLKDIKVLEDIKFKPAIKCFYNEFGCEVVEKANGNTRATARTNLLIQCDGDTGKKYKSLIFSLFYPT